MDKFSKYIIRSVLLPCFVFGAINKAQGSQPQQTLCSQQQTICQITPPHGPLSKNNIDVVIDIEFLWWYATVGNLPYAYVEEVVLEGSSLNPTRIVRVPDRMKEFGSEWDPGIRLGLGIITNHDGWDVYANWTYFRNSDDESVSVPPFSNTFANSITNPPGQHVLASPWFIDATQGLFSSINGKWDLLFHQIDLILGRKFWISPNLVLHPYVGLRGNRSRLSLNITGNLDGSLTENNFFAIERANWKQQFWGVGLLGGMDTVWHLTKHWSIFGESDIALIYGRYEIRDRYSFFFGSFTQTNLDISHTYNNDNIYSFQPIIDLGIGIRWETTFLDECYRINIDAGWENHIWIDFNKLTRPLTDKFQNQSFMSSEGNLSISGLVIRGRFEF